MPLERNRPCNGFALFACVIEDRRDPEQLAHSGTCSHPNLANRVKLLPRPTTRFDQPGTPGLSAQALCPLDRRGPGLSSAFKIKSGQFPVPLPLSLPTKRLLLAAHIPGASLAMAPAALDGLFVLIFVLVLLFLLLVILLELRPVDVVVLFLFGRARRFARENHGQKGVSGPPCQQETLVAQFPRT